jgi:hypothetical protein
VCHCLVELQDLNYPMFSILREVSE